MVKDILAPHESFKHFHGEDNTATLSEESAHFRTGNIEHLLKVSCLLTRRADLTHEEFISYWTEKHTKMLAKPQPGAPKVYRYIQLHPTNNTLPGLKPAPYDGVAEIWFDKLEDAAAMFTSNHYNTVVAKDEENFLDRSKTAFLYSHEKSILDVADQTKTGDTLLKVSCFLVRRSDLSHEKFFRYWTRKHMPLLARSMPWAPKIAHSIHLHTIPESVPGLLTAPYDGVAEIWFENLEDAEALFANEYYINVAGKDEENFLDRSKTTFLFSLEKKIF